VTPSPPQSTQLAASPNMPCCRYECARVAFAPVAVQLLSHAAACAGITAPSSPTSAAALMTELPQRSMQSLRASAALIASVANVAYTPQGKQALAAEWAGKEGGAVALVAPLLLFDPPGVALRGERLVEWFADMVLIIVMMKLIYCPMYMTTAAEGASRALVNMSGHDKLANPMKDDVFLCLCAGQQTPAHRRHLPPLPNHLRPSSLLMLLGGKQHLCRSFSCARQTPK
jgi:hypothetical protein